jgi:tyrosine-protein phosphatase SIW14
MVRIRYCMTTLIGTLSAFALLAGAQPARSQTINQTSNALEGLPSWGRVTDLLYRGGQPALAGFKALQHMGVAIIVNFRDEPEELAAEQHEVESLGMKYVSIPWSGSNEPSSSQVVQFLDLIRANPQAKIFVHCKRGADRTGVMIAAYRIAVERRTVAEAVSEMHQFHYDHFWLPQLERYVKSLPQLLLGNPLFSAYAPIPSTPSAPHVVTPGVGVAPPPAAASSAALVQ